MRFLISIFSPPAQINDIGPESRAFNVTCTPCKQQINTIEDLGIHCSSKQHGEIIAKQLKEKYPGLESNVSQSLISVF